MRKVHLLWEKCHSVLPDANAMRSVRINGSSRASHSNYGSTKVDSACFSSEFSIACVLHLALSAVTPHGSFNRDRVFETRGLHVVARVRHVAQHARNLRQFGEATRRHVTPHMQLPATRRLTRKCFSTSHRASIGRRQHSEAKQPSCRRGENVGLTIRASSPVSSISSGTRFTSASSNPASL